MTITKSGFYEIKSKRPDHGILASGDCIKIAAKNVTLTGIGSVSGNGQSGIGIHVLKGETGFTMVRGLVTGFAVGIEIDSDDAHLTEVIADRNADTGVLVNGAKNGLFQVSTSSNGQAGIHLHAASGNEVEESSTLSNGVYGIWIDSSNGNHIERCEVSDLVYFGCSPSGTGGNCPTPGVSSGNGVAVSTIATLVLDPGNSSNVMTGNSISTSHDGNPGCAGDFWMGDGIIRPSQSCEQ